MEIVAQQNVRKFTPTGNVRKLEIASKWKMSENLENVLKSNIIMNGKLSFISKLNIVKIKYVYQALLGQYFIFIPQLNPPAFFFLSE